MKQKLIQSVKTVLHLLGVDVVRFRGDACLPHDFLPSALEVWDAVKQYTMASPERIATLCDAVRYVEKHNITGSMVECGVWRGGSMMAVAKTLIREGSSDRDLYLFDTFEGMPPATEADVDPNGVAAESIFGKERASNLPWDPEPVDGVKNALFSTGYPEDKCHFIKGKVEDTVPDNAPTEIALLRLDTDWYESTKHELIHLFPRITNGGVIIIDDYGYWKGARKAVDEYLAEHSIKILLVRVDDTARMAVIQR